MGAIQATGKPSSFPLGCLKVPLLLPAKSAHGCMRAAKERTCAIDRNARKPGAPLRPRGGPFKTSHETTQSRGSFPESEAGPYGT
jgi:hypothetical protein